MTQAILGITLWVLPQVIHTHPHDSVGRDAADTQVQSLSYHCVRRDAAGFTSQGTNTQHGRDTDRGLQCDESQGSTLYFFSCYKAVISPLLGVKRLPILGAAKHMIPVSWSVSRISYPLLTTLWRQ